MASLKQIEVNGTTYDIGVSGSELPIIFETYIASGSGDGAAGKLNAGSDGTAFYQTIQPDFVLKSVDNGDGTYTQAIVIALDTDALTVENTDS